MVSSGVPFGCRCTAPCLLFHTDLQQRDPDTFKPLHVVSMTIRDSADDSAAAAGDVLDLCKMVNERAEWRWWLVAWLFFVPVCLQKGRSGWGELLDGRSQAAERSCSSGRRRVRVLERGMGSPKVVVKGRVGTRRQPNNVTGCSAGRNGRRRFGRALFVPTVGYCSECPRRILKVVLAYGRLSPTLNNVRLLVFFSAAHCAPDPARIPE
ncbi:unnamed protein product, partial [Ectocarpus sp. 8 AP-2014]